MIVRIQQFQLIDAERFAAWPAQGATAPLSASFAPGTNAYELSVLETDEQGRAVPMERRHGHLRGLIAPLAETLREPDCGLVLRLDGPLSPGELPPAFEYLTDAQGMGRFAFSGGERFEPEASNIGGSIRIEPDGAALAALCAEARLGIDRGVRMRLFCLPRELVNPLLDIPDADDERWPEILPAARFMLQNTHGLDALHVITRLGAEELSDRISGQLGGGAA
jgi:hypothetical protein